MGLIGPACGRVVHLAPKGTDATPACLMHSKDNGKRSGRFFEAFWREFEKTLEAAGSGEAHFGGFVFPELNFTDRRFHAKCDFENCIFTQKATFLRARFDQEAEFAGTTFEALANFDGAQFELRADFLAATFQDRSSFSHARFSRDVTFLGATFVKEAAFWATVFSGEADFAATTFALSANFTKAGFLGMAKWNYASFQGGAKFKEVKFEAPEEVGPCATFEMASFSRPETVLFDEVNLSRVMFHNCDVSGVWFASVVWGRRPTNAGIQLYEEIIPKENSQAQRVFKNGKDGGRDYPLVAQTYQQLKKNYDGRLDYWTANDFHYGEMEMKRLAVPTSGRWLALRRWWHKHLSLVAFYKYGSNYGNDYWKPIWLLIGVLVVTALLLPWIGLQSQHAEAKTSDAAITYASVWKYGPTAEKLWWEAGLAGEAFLTSVDTAMFQKSPEYAPAYPLGRVLTIGETLLTSTLFGLFLLAIRRQFRR
jgi:hypothetical protein